MLQSDSLTVDQIRTHLRAKLANPATDSSTDGGEAGLTSLNRALDDDRMTLAKSQGFFRDDAALAVVFVADENDVCAIYPSGVTPVVDTNNIEPTATVRDCHRTAPARTKDGVVLTPSYAETITSTLVLGKLQALKGDLPLVTSGVIYFDSATTPNTDENEIGYGYKELIEASNGVFVDMASGNYETGLNEIGALATVRMNLNLDFNLTHGNVDPDSLEVKVDGVGVSGFSYNAEVNVVHLASAGTASSVIDVSYCEIEEEEPLPEGGADDMCLAGSFQPKPMLKVGISIDPAEGAMPQILNGLSLIGVTPTQYSNAQVIAGQPTADGVTVLVIARRAVITGISAEYVAAVRTFIQNGGSVMGEYDGAALMFMTFTGANPALLPNFTNAFQLFDGNSAGGGLLLPLSASALNVTDPTDPLMAGLSNSTMTSGLRRAFAVTGFDSNWLHASATFTSVGTNGLVPAGTYPAVMKGRCGTGRVVLFTMNHLEAANGTSAAALNAGLIVHNAFQWLIGTTN